MQIAAVGAWGVALSIPNEMKKIDRAGREFDPDDDSSTDTTATVSRDYPLSSTGGEA